MRIEPPFPMPEEPPIVPEHLSERIINLLPDTTKIAVKVGSKGGWQAVCTIHLDGDEDATEVYTVVKAGADYHSRTTGHTGKYRAQIWVLAPGKIQPARHTVTFKVESEHEEHEPEEAADRMERRAQIEAWLELVDREHRLTNVAMRYSQNAFDALLKQSSTQSEQVAPLTGLVTQCVGMYSDGLKMKADSIRELGDMRVAQKLAEAGSDDSGQMWEAFMPAIQVAAMQFQQRMLGGRAPSRALPAVAANGPPGMPTTAARAHAPPPGPPTVSTAAAAPPAAPASPSTSPPSSSPPAPPMSIPSTLHGLAALVIEGLGADRVIRMMRLLSEQQAQLFERVVLARDDDSAAQAVVALMGSLMADPGTMMQVQQLLLPEHLQALQQLGVLAQRYVNERAAAAASASAPVTDEPGAEQD